MTKASAPEIFGWGFAPVQRQALALLPSARDVAVYTVIVARARHEEATVATAKGTIRLRPGQAVIGQRELAARLQTGRQAIRGSLSRLKALRILDLEETRSGTVVTLRDYDRYLGARREEQPTEQPAGQPTRQPSSNPQATHKDPLTTGYQSTEDRIPDTGGSPRAGSLDGKARALAIAASEAFAAIGQRRDPHADYLVKLCKALARAQTTPDEVQEVIAAKAAEWQGSDNARWLQPSTLLAAKNFAKYLAEDVPRWKATRVRAPLVSVDSATSEPRRGYYRPDDEAAFSGGSVDLDAIAEEFEGREALGGR